MVSQTACLKLDLLKVPTRSFVRQRKHSTEEERGTKKELTFERSTSIDSGVFLTPPSSPGVFLTPPSSPRVFLTPPSSPGIILTAPSSPQLVKSNPSYFTFAHMPSSTMYGQQGASLAFTFMIEQEMGLEKLKQE